MNNQNIRRELLTIFMILLIFICSLTLLKLYDTKTDKIGTIGKIFVSKYITILNEP